MTVVGGIVTVVGGVFIVVEGIVIVVGDGHWSPQSTTQVSPSNLYQLLHFSKFKLLL